MEETKDIRNNNCRPLTDMEFDPIYEYPETIRESRQVAQNGIFIPISPMIAEKETSFAAKVKI